MKFDHVGLVVRKLQRGRDILQKTVGVASWSAEFEDAVNGVICQFGLDEAGVCYELLQPLGDDSPVSAALSSRKAILNHVAYLVDDLGAAQRRLQAAGSAPTGAPKPAIAYDGARIQFFVTPLNFIIEMIEAPAHKHVYLSS